VKHHGLIGVYSIPLQVVKLQQISDMVNGEIVINIDRQRADG